MEGNRASRKQAHKAIRQDLLRKHTKARSIRCLNNAAGVLCEVDLDGVVFTAPYSCEGKVCTLGEWAFDR